MKAYFQAVEEFRGISLDKGSMSTLLLIYGNLSTARYYQWVHDLWSGRRIGGKAVVGRQAVWSPP